MSLIVLVCQLSIFIFMIYITGKSLTNAAGEKSVSVLTVEVIIYYKRRPWVVSQNNVISHSKLKPC